MKRFWSVIWWGIACIPLVIPLPVAWAQAGAHVSVGLGHGEEGFLHLEEMVKHLEFGLNMPDADEAMRKHGPMAVQHAKEALKHYNEALKHASESLGRRTRGPMMEGSQGNSHDEGSRHEQEGSGGSPY